MTVRPPAGPLDGVVVLGRAGYDQIAQGETGLMSMTGSGPEGPQKFGTPTCDLLADGIVQVVVPEDPPAHQDQDPTGSSRRIAAECPRQIADQR